MRWCVINIRDILSLLFRIFFDALLNLESAILVYVGNVKENRWNNKSWNSLSPEIVDYGSLKNVKVAHTWLPSVGFRSWFQFLAVSLQVTWIINPAVGCHYFPPGPQLPLQPLRGLLPICWLVNRDTMGVNSLPKTVIRQRRDCDLNPGLLRLSPAR